MLEAKRIFWLEFIGAICMILLGSAMHFACSWCGEWKPLALLAAVNESIWEHLKLAFWPGLLWACIMPLPSHLGRWEVVSAKGFSLAITATLIVAIFTSYTAILGRNLLALDIGTFVLAICVGQLVLFLLLVNRTSLLRPLFVVGLAALLVQLAAYSLFTFFPPDHWLFIEARTGLSGIPVK
ncbi:DUF6512 family protein [Pseudophaeobacter sp. TrK17]|uniref:DUF6512 family protein n=1 Tax=Pseudophaeobacter sp. TrK17 TaxID=2815167 RepID=UPI0035D0C93E